MRSVLHKTHRDRKYTTINLTCVEDSRLSGLAKAVHLYAMSRPPDWDLNTQDVINRFKEGKRAIYHAMQELVETGYLQRERERNGQRFGPIVLHWYENPQRSRSEEVQDEEVQIEELHGEDIQDSTAYYIPEEQRTKEPTNKVVETGATKPTITGADWAKQHITEGNPWYAVAQNLRRKLKAHTGSSTVWLAAKLRETYADIYAPEAVDAQIDKRIAEGRTDCKYWELFTEGNHGQSRRSHSAGTGQPSRYAAIVHEKDAGGTDAGVLLSDLYDGRDI